MKTPLLLVLSFPIAVLACSSGEKSPNPPPATPRDYCDAFRVGCERQVECGVVVYNHLADVSSCVTETRCSELTAEVTTALGVRVDDAKVKSCIDKLRVASCSQVAALRFGFGAFFQECTNVTEGTKPLGEPCQSLAFDDCAAGLACDFSAGCPGTCKEEGQPCVQGHCGDGEYCSYLSERCEPLVGPGGSCEPNEVGDLHRQSCQRGLYCENDPNGWVCQPTIAPGQPCESCGDPACCTDGYYCPTGPGSVCEPRAGEGQPCSTGSVCSAGLYCDFEAGECRPRGQAGEACNASEGSCQLGLECSVVGEGTGVCQSPLAEPPSEVQVLGEGDTCRGAQACPLGMACVGPDGKPLSDPNASAGTCRPSLGQPGDACEPILDPHACERGVCDFSTKLCPELLELGSPCEPDGLNAACPHALCLKGRCAGPGDLVCGSL